MTREQRADQTAKAKEASVEFISLSAADKAQLSTEAKPVYDSWGEEIGRVYRKTVQSVLGN